MIPENEPQIGLDEIKRIIVVVASAAKMVDNLKEEVHRYDLYTVSFMLNDIVEDYRELLDD